MERLLEELFAAYDLDQILELSGISDEAVIESLLESEYLELEDLEDLLLDDGEFEEDDE